jgi:hypothetical protein
MTTRPPGKLMVRRVGHWFGWLALVVMLLALLTGYGITQFRVVDPLTFGLLGKAVSQRWHETVAVLMAALLTVHVGVALWWRLRGSSS